MRPIDADALKQHIDKLPALPDGNFAGNHSALKALINMQPTIEPERKRGRWTKAYDGNDGHVKCTECFKTYDWISQAQYYNYCPNCGSCNGGDQE